MRRTPTLSPSPSETFSMAADRKLNKERKCRVCGASVYGTATDVADHARICQRAQDAGIIIPSIVLTDGGS